MCKGHANARAMLNFCAWFQFENMCCQIKHKVARLFFKMEGICENIFEQMDHEIEMMRKMEKGKSDHGLHGREGFGQYQRVILVEVIRKAS